MIPGLYLERKKEEKEAADDIRAVPLERALGRTRHKSLCHILPSQSLNGAAERTQVRGYVVVRCGLASGTCWLMDGCWLLVCVDVDVN